MEPVLERTGKAANAIPVTFPVPALQWSRFSKEPESRTTATGTGPRSPRCNGAGSRKNRKVDVPGIAEVSVDPLQWSRFSKEPERGLAATTAGTAIYGLQWSRFSKEPERARFILGA